MDNIRLKTLEGRVRDQGWEIEQTFTATNGIELRFTMYRHGRFRDCTYEVGKYSGDGNPAITCQIARQWAIENFAASYHLDYP